MCDLIGCSGITGGQDLRSDWLQWYYLGQDLIGCSGIIGGRICELIGYSGIPIR